MKILAIDPGPVESAYCVFDGERVVIAGKVPNDAMNTFCLSWHVENSGPAVIEMIASYGMPVGAEVFETCVWIGRFLERLGGNAERVPRIKVKTHLCHSAKAKDSNVRQALIDRIGPVGTKKDQGPCFGMAGDMWSALAVAVYAWDTARGLRN